MLTDIFAERYATVPIWQDFGEAERKLLVQAFRMVNEQLFPYWDDEGKERPESKAVWNLLHNRLTMELGLQELAPLGYWAETTLAGAQHKYWQQIPIVHVCQNFVCASYPPGFPADRFIKDRLSFIEIAFREKEHRVAADNATLSQRLAQAEIGKKALKGLAALIPGDAVEVVRLSNEMLNNGFRASVKELNERFRRAGMRLNYHNGFIQVSEDELVDQQVETPFWGLVKDPKWKNVDIDMKEAIDRRDSGGRDPAFYATRALESAIKIISAERGWTRGDEKGAHGFIDNLASSKNGGFIEKWEQVALKAIFTEVRNELGHGPGPDPMKHLSPQQTNWVIEACMSWTRSLILRM